MKMLIVEDDPVSSLVLERALSSLGHELVIARDGKKALEQFMKSPFQIVLSDWMMPEMDGLELCRRLKEFCASMDYRCYFIMVTAKGQRSDIVEALDAGTDDFITKPIDRKVLFTRLEIAERIMNGRADENSSEGMLVTMLEEDHRRMLETAQKLDTDLLSVGSLSGVEKLKEDVYSLQSSLYNVNHIEMENIYINAFLNSIISEGNMWLEELSSSSFAKLQEDHEAIKDILESLFKNVHNHKECLNQLAQQRNHPNELKKAIDHGFEEDDKPEEIMERIVKEIRSSLDTVAISRQSVESILIEYTTMVRKHIQMEGSNFFPFAQKHITPDEEAAALEQCREKGTEEGGKITECSCQTAQSL